MSSISPAELQHRIARLRAAREHFLIRRSVQDILASLGWVTSRFLDPTSAERQEAETQLPHETGLSRAMVQHALPLIFQEYQSSKLVDLLNDELGAYSRLDRFAPTPSGDRRVFSFPLVTQILAGNLPGAGLDSIIFTLLVKSATLVKTASSSAALPQLFARTLARVDRELAECLAVVTWSGGSTALEEVVFSHADLVIASGADESLASIRQRVHGRFIGYGHKVSFSVIGKEALAQSQQLAHAAAYDVALFDQQGCLSPQLIYVEEGGAINPKEFAALLAQGLAYWQQELPRGTIPQNASAAIRRVRDEAEWQALAGKDVALFASSHGTEWTVIYEADPTFRPSPLYRTIRVKPFTSLPQLSALLTPWHPHLEAAGVAMSREHLLATAEVLGRAGVSRICPLGQLQTPPLSWRHGGRPRIADLVRWVEVG